MRPYAAFAVLLAVLLGSVPGWAASPYAGFRSAVAYSENGRDSGRCGTAMASDEHARLDVEFRKVGAFTLLVDAEERRLYVLSQKLKAYVSMELEGDARSWRDLVESASAAIMPQSLGLVSIKEIRREELGRRTVLGHAAEGSRSVFELMFMGVVRQFTVEAWDSGAVSPFPLKVSLPAGQEAQAGSAWLEDVASVRVPESEFMVPEHFTRYTSVMDLLLYALTAL